METDVYSLADVIKRYYRELPESVFTDLLANTLVEIFSREYKRHVEFLPHNGTQQWPIQGFTFFNRTKFGILILFFLVNTRITITFFLNPPLNELVSEV